MNDVIDAVLQKDALRLFPDWSQAMRDRWVAARRKANTCKPSFGRLLPMTMEQVARPGRNFAPRSLKEAFQ